MIRSGNNVHDISLGKADNWQMDNGTTRNKDGEMDLIRRACAKDADAFTALMESRMQPMYKVARTILRSDEDAADAIQDTILACWEHMASLRELRFFKTWQTKVLIGKCNDIVRKRHGETALPDEVEIPSQETEYGRCEWNATLMKLDERYRLPLLLYYIDGFRVTEIAAILGRTESTVRTQLQRGREMLALILGEERTTGRRRGSGGTWMMKDEQMRSGNAPNLLPNTMYFTAPEWRTGRCRTGRETLSGRISE